MLGPYMSEALDSQVKHEAVDYLRQKAPKTVSCLSVPPETKVRPGHLCSALSAWAASFMEKTCLVRSLSSTLAALCRSGVLSRPDDGKLQYRPGDVAALEALFAPGRIRTPGSMMGWFRGVGEGEGEGEERSA